MERLNVELGERSYPISIGAGLLSDPALFSYLKPNIVGRPYWISLWHQIPHR